SKHIDIDYHFIRELVQSNILKLVHVKSQHQVVDVFTKPLMLLAFSFFIRMLGLINIY
ncbi:Copia protein, partial [Glycine soja]